MNQKEVICERAVKHFLGGYNCAQSVLLAMSEHWNCKSGLIPRIATGFGGGIGLCGSVCGALTGGVMAIGIKYGTNEPSHEKRERAYELCRNLFRAFEKRHGTTMCRELVKYDLSNPYGLKKARKAKVFEEKCPDFVRTAVKFLIELDANSS
jgi:C_GCAxxG_C_C family probable redox protein